MTRRSRNLLLPGVALLALAMLASGLARADHQDRLQGPWAVTHAEVGSLKLTRQQLKGFAVIVEGDKFTLVEGTRKEVVHFTLDPKAAPSHIDFFKTNLKKERVWHGIYDFDGQTVKLCWGPAGQARPKRFGPKKEHRYFILRKK